MCTHFIEIGNNYERCAKCIAFMMDTEANGWGATQNCVNNNKQNGKLCVSAMTHVWQITFIGTHIAWGMTSAPHSELPILEKHQFYDYPTDDDDYYYYYYHIQYIYGISCVLSKITRENSAGPDCARTKNNDLLFVQAANLIFGWIFVVVLFRPLEKSCSLCVNIRGDMCNQRADKQCA